MAKGNKNDVVPSSLLVAAERRIAILAAKLVHAERVRREQVDELLAKQSELMSDVADLLIRCVPSDSSE